MLFSVSVFFSFVFSYHRLLPDSEFYLKDEFRYLRRFLENDNFKEDYVLTWKLNEIISECNTKFERVERLCLYPDRSKNLFVSRSVRIGGFWSVSYILCGLAKTVCILNDNEGCIDMNGVDYFLAQDDKTLDEDLKFSLLIPFSEQYNRNINWVYFLEGNVARKTNMIFVKHVSFIDHKKPEFTLSRSERYIIDSMNLYVVLNDIFMGKSFSEASRSLKQLLKKYHTDKAAELSPSENLKHSIISYKLAFILDFIDEAKHLRLNGESYLFSNGYYTNALELSPETSPFVFCTTQLKNLPRIYENLKHSSSKSKRIPRYQPLKKFHKEHFVTNQNRNNQLMIKYTPEYHHNLNKKNTNGKKGNTFTRKLIIFIPIPLLFIAITALFLGYFMRKPKT